jgi:hypothetical protein
MTKRLLPLMLILLMLPVSINAATQLINPEIQFDDDNGDPCSGCLLFFYTTGTSTKKDTYTDADAGTANDNPIELSSTGSADIWIDGQYRVILAPSSDADPPVNPYWTVDDVSSLIGLNEFLVGHTSAGVHRGYRLLSEFDDLADAVLSIGATKTELWLDQSDSSSATVPTTLSVRPIIGNIMSGTVTWNGPIVGQPLFEWLSGSGHTLGSASTPYVYPEWWGAVQGGAAGVDAATEINYCAAAAYGTAGGNDSATIVFSGGPGFATTDTIAIPGDVNVDMQSILYYTGSQEEPAITIGSASDQPNRQDLRIKVTRNTQADWTNEANIGVKIWDANGCRIHLDICKGFTIGAQFISETQAMLFNTVYLGQFLNNGVALDLYTTGAYVRQANNENVFIGGQLTIDSNVHTTLGRTGIRIWSDTTGAGVYYSNNNVFYKPSVELGAANTTGTCVAFDIQHGQYNSWVGARDEGNDTGWKFSNNSYGNRAEFCFNNTDNSDLTDEQDNYIVGNRSYSRNANTGAQFFNSGPLHKNACYSDGATYVNIPNVSLTASSGADIWQSLNSITMNEEYVEFSSSRGVGIFVNTLVAKRFIIRRDSIASRGGRIIVRAYDSSGSPLDDSGGDHVFGLSGRTFDYSANFGQVWTTGSDDTADIYFRVSSSVEYIYVGIIGGTATARLKSFSLYSLDGYSPATWTGYEEVVKGSNTGTAAPTEGFGTTPTAWARGRTVWDYTPTSAAAQGWVCVFSLDTTLNGGEPSGETSMVVTSSTGALNGDVIGVLQDDGTTQWTTIASGQGTTTLVLTAGLTDDAADGNAVRIFRFVAMAVLQ